MSRPKDSSFKVADWSTPAKDWIGLVEVVRRRVQRRCSMHPAASTISISMLSQLLRHDCSTRAALLGVRWCTPHAQRSKTAHVACNLLADLDGDPARRNVCRVGRLAEHSCSARGASWLAARRPRGDGKARLVMQPVVRSFGIALPALDLPPAASVPGRGRTMSDRRRSL